MSLEYNEQKGEPMKKYFMLIAVIGLALSCTKKVKQAETPVETAPPTDTKIESTPLSFDSAGSDSGKIAGLKTVHFEYDKSSLSEKTKKELQGNAAWMKANPSVKIQIEGHCDARGSQEYNLALGERRANAAKAYLKSQGINESRLAIISYGKERPLESGDSEQAYAQNRRANFVPLQ